MTLQQFISGLEIPFSGIRVGSSSKVFCWFTPRLFAFALCVLGCFNGVLVFHPGWCLFWWCSWGCITGIQVAGLVTWKLCTVAICCFCYSPGMVISLLLLVKITLYEHSLGVYGTHAPVVYLFRIKHCLFGKFLKVCSSEYELVIQISPLGVGKIMSWHFHVYRWQFD